MIKSIDKPNWVNLTGTFQSEDATQDRTSVRCKSNQTIIQQLYHPESKLVDLWVCGINMGPFSQVGQERF